MQYLHNILSKVGDKVFKRESFSRIISLCIIIVLFMLLYLFPLNGSSQQLGSHLKYSIEKNKVTVVLDQYFDCEYAEISEEEKATIYETMALGSFVEVKLKKVGAEDLQNNNSAPCSSVNGCIKKVRYSGEVYLREVPGGYDLIWRNCCNPLDLSNFNLGSEDGYVLQCHIDEKAFNKNNTAAELLSLPPFKACNTYENTSIINAMDTVDGDQIRLQFFEVFSDNSTSDPTANQRKNSYKKVLIPPPFEVLKYQTNYSHQSPLGKEAQIKLEENILRLTSKESGRFLMGLSIEEYRKETIISSSQFVFITHIN